MAGRQRSMQSMHISECACSSFIHCNMYQRSKLAHRASSCDLQLQGTVEGKPLAIDSRRMPSHAGAAERGRRAAEAAQRREKEVSSGRSQLDLDAYLPNSSVREAELAQTGYFALGSSSPGPAEYTPATVGTIDDTLKSLHVPPDDHHRAEHGRAIGPLPHVRAAFPASHCRQHACTGTLPDTEPRPTGVQPTQGWYNGTAPKLSGGLLGQGEPCCPVAKGAHTVRV